MPGAGGLTVGATVGVVSVGLDGKLDVGAVVEVVVGVDDVVLGGLVVVAGWPPPLPWANSSKP